jgi:hypothetical protein
MFTTTREHRVTQLIEIAEADRNHVVDYLLVSPEFSYRHPTTIWYAANYARVIALANAVPAGYSLANR